MHQELTSAPTFQRHLPVSSGLQMLAGEGLLMPVWNIASVPLLVAHLGLHR